MRNSICFILFLLSSFTVARGQDEWVKKYIEEKYGLLMKDSVYITINKITETSNRRIEYAFPSKILFLEYSPSGKLARVSEYAPENKDCIIDTLKAEKLVAKKKMLPGGWEKDTIKNKVVARIINSDGIFFHHDYSQNETTIEFYKNDKLHGSFLRKNMTSYLYYGEYKHSKLIEFFSEKRAFSGRRKMYSNYGMKHGLWILIKEGTIVQEEKYRYGKIIYLKKFFTNEINGKIFYVKKRREQPFQSYR